MKHDLISCFHSMKQNICIERKQNFTMSIFWFPLSMCENKNENYLVLYGILFTFFSEWRRKYRELCVSVSIKNINIAFILLLKSHVRYFLYRKNL